MGGIFINFRRNDEQGVDVVRRLDRALEFFGEGNVFLDERSLGAGDYYPGEITRRVDECEVLLAVIDPRWTTARNGKGVRLIDREVDWVRREIAQALDRGKKVVPVLILGATPPKPEELPRSIRGLSLAQARVIRDDADIEALVDELQEYVAPVWVEEPAERTKPSSPRPWVRPAAVVLGVVAAVGPWVLVPDDAEMRFAAFLTAFLLLSTMVGPLVALSLALLLWRRATVMDADVQEMPLNRYYARIAIPVVVLGAVLLAAALAGSPVSPRVVPVLVFLVLSAVVRSALTILREQKRERLREERWPQRLSTPVRPAVVRSESARLARRLAAWPEERRLSRVMRDKSESKLRDLCRAAGALEQDSRRRRWEWLFADHPGAACLMVVWVAGTTGLFAAGLRHGVWQFAIVGGVLALALAAACVELGYRRQRVVHQAVADEVRRGADEARRDLERLLARRR
ncbi:uncharacterized protein (DUF1778 family) [Saccharothrix tamanrassetensis]|uniref:Uncharacterized protein (DUF1778 family) n=1 Tax=Saccharothrix tamanrassetensis TaxID=1051531 RepID=A0A841CW33_9PSEU|nr:toll/interleukin-1 receptor domain-containing protein [Saccharothrix tamanrassetensis]MBB5959586.1 uncharacterized protein (DUF1778 family) [Saccharothrix tamanrassetensis]